MAYTPLKISIPEPCHEDWNGMHPVPGTTARHCDSCAKNVVDFTGFSDAKMHAYVREQGGKLCGRFRPDQLNRPLRAISTPTSNPLKVAAAAAGVLLAATGCDAPKEATVSPLINEARQQPVEQVLLPAVTGGITAAEVEQILTAVAAQEKEAAILDGIASPPLPPPPPVAKVGEFIAESMPPPAYEEAEMLRGKPVVEALEEEPFITCGLKGVGQETIEGEIELMKEDFLVGDIDISESIELPPIYPIEQDTLPPEDEGITSEVFSNLPIIEISTHQGVMMGIVAIEHPRPTGMDWVKDTLKNVLPSLPTLPSQDPSLHQRPRPETPQYLEALTVFPNPFVDHLKIEINLPAKETLMVELIDPTGRLVFARGWKARAGINTLKIEPKHRKLKHTLYYLRVTDGKGFSVQRAVIRN